MIQKVNRFVTDDGFYFATESEALSHDVELRVKKTLLDRNTSLYGICDDDYDQVDTETLVSLVVLNLQTILDAVDTARSEQRKERGETA